MKTLSLTRALAELKLYDKKIEKVISTLNPTAAICNNTIANSQKTVEEFTADYTAAKQSLTDLRTNKAKLKKAINTANANTLITVAGHQMSIVEAIQRKNDIDIDKQILDRMVRQFNEVANTVNRNNDNLDDQIHNTIQQRSTSSGQLSKDYAESIRESMEKLSKFEVLNQVQVESEIANLQDFITTFEAEIDMVLSEANARTDIEVDI